MFAFKQFGPRNGIAQSDMHIIHTAPVETSHPHIGDVTKLYWKHEWDCNTFATACQVSVLFDYYSLYMAMQCTGDLITDSVVMFRGY